MPTKLLPIIAFIGVAAVAIGVFVGVTSASNGNDHVQDAPTATTEVATTTEAPTSTTTSGSSCGLLGTVKITVREVKTSSAPGAYPLGFTFQYGDRVPCLERDKCWIKVLPPEWARDDVAPGTEHYLHLGVTNATDGMPGGPCSSDDYA